MEIKGDGDVRQTEGAAAAPSLPTQCPLPTCRSKDFAKLNQLGGFQLYQCGKCLHEWKVPLSDADRAAAVVRLASTPPEQLRAGEICAKGCGEEFRYPPMKKRHEAGCLGRRKPETGRRAKETSVANVKLVCKKGCGRDFNREAWREKHEAKCRGEASAPPRTKTTPTKLRSKAGNAHFMSPVAEAVEVLRKRREALIAEIPELQEIDKAIAALAGLGEKEKAKDPS